MTQGENDPLREPGPTVWVRTNPPRGPVYAPPVEATTGLVGAVAEEAPPGTMGQAPFGKLGARKIQ